MRKKARIDLLEIDEAQEKEPEAVKEREEEAPSETTVSYSRFFHWKFLLFVALPIFCALLVISAVTYFFLIGTETRIAKKQEAPGSVATSAPMVIEIGDLSSVVSDVSGQDRIIIFSLTLVTQPGKEMAISAEDAKIRAIAVQSAGEIPNAEILSAGGRESLKSKVQQYLEKEWGAGSVQAVYVTSWTVI